MKYDVTYSCGHTGVIVLFGPTRDREWKLRRETEKLCAECYQKKREEVHDELLGKEHLKELIKAL